MGAQGFDPNPLGQLLILPGQPLCIPGYTCRFFEVTDCPNVRQAAQGIFAVSLPAGSPRGLIMFFSGAYGTEWWSAGGGLAGDFINHLLRNGVEVVQVKWIDSWLISSPGEDSGSGNLACRPATAVRWIHDSLYSPLGIKNSIGRCGFCITGNSGGASQVAYSLSFYGLASIVDAAIPTSGPPHAAQDKGCLRDPSQASYWYDAEATIHIDASYGFAQNQQGPCALHDPAWQGQWVAQSVDTGANSLVYPTTRVVFIIGGLDPSSAPAHAGDFYDALVAASSPMVSWEFVPTMGHGIQLSRDGLAALQQAILY